ncbi:metallophosphoesterase [Methylotenera sp.]|uniref:metallophosphoesterase n=1 Tax=Methylotenera sp. TaxID=2051956 RepID=UPI002723B155|nr:metallophosphoesterase [Methylotenera sp.]MDO9204056.1 metallophosphoesterase [Methylotenera sp.]
MAAMILHLSDIHIKGIADPILKHANEIAACTYNALPDASAVFILISGDIAFSGKAEQYDAARTLLNQIKVAIQAEKNVQVHFVIAPGNHDCDFDRDNALRQMAIKCLNEGSYPIDNAVIDQCTAVQEDFFNFKKSLESEIKSTGDKLWETLVFEVDEKSIVFDTLNLSWVSRLHEEQGGVVFPHDHYLFKQAESAHVRVVVMHHPLNWFNQSSYRSFRQFVRTLATIIITGHEHQANAGENIDTESSISAYIEGDVLQDNNGLVNSAFNLITLDLDEDTYKSNRFAWKEKRYESTEEGSWSDYRKLPPKRHNTFEIQNEFRQKLDDAGANFQYPGRTKISLSDIFIYQDLLEAGSDKRPGNFINSKALVDPDKTAKGVLLEGEEKVGCTSLLYRLYDQYHERGFVPLYIIGSDIKKNNPQDIDALIRKAVIEQYGDKAITNFEQLANEKKLLLLDDLDDSPARSIKDRAKALCSLRKRFGHFVVTVGAFFEVRELLLEAASTDLLDFSHYQVQPFGYSLRGKLIKKWSSLGNDGTLDEAMMISKVDQVEKAMDVVMGKNIIPSMPLYLLTLLQSIEAGRSGDFNDSALGHYYDYLLTEGLLAAYVPKEKLKEYYDYCTELSWYFHNKNCRELSRVELLEFNLYFSTKFQTTDFNARLEKLIQSKVLMNRGGEYFSFRYPYIYYFLKGRYLNKNLSDIGIRGYLEQCCKHLYVRENANTILFLAHHTNGNDDFVMRTILEALQSLFSENKPITFNKDTDKLALLISDAAKLKYSGTPPEAYREKVNQARDQLDDGQDGLADKEEDGDSLSLIAQLVTLFKTVEISGQILKNQYSSIERDKKATILNELFSGPLRALSGFYEFINNNPDLLVAEIDSVLKIHHKLDDELERKKISRQIIARLIQFTSLGFIYKASSSVGADTLREDIHSVVEKNGTAAFQLIELGVLLDSSSPIPRNFLLKLKENTKKDIVALSLINMLVVRHLYMFKTSEQDKQWLRSKFEIDLGMQHALDFKSSKIKRLK